jgi:hypothetical protein
MPLPTEELRRRADAYKEHGTLKKAAAALGVKKSALSESLRRAAEAGLLGTEPVLPGFRISKISNTPSGTFIQQTQERGEKFAVPTGHVVKGVSALVDAEGRVIQQWQKTAVDAVERAAAMRAAVEAFKEDLPRAEPVARPQKTHADLLNFYAVTDGLVRSGHRTGASGSHWCSGADGRSCALRWHGK